MTESLTAFELLLQIDQRCRLLAADLPSQPTRQDSWSGIGFRLGEHWYVAPMGEVSEVLHEPRFTQVPGVKSWVKGVANLRGRLLPIMDLGAFFSAKEPGHELSTPRRQRRVLVVEHQEVFAGLMVDEVFGLQHFARDSLEPVPADEAPGPMSAFVEGCFQGEQNWRVFSPFAFVRSQGFMNIAV
ncbi:chemotaxis protein CheW [Pseudomonas izuensis]|uniref:Chemotaxis protein CheW n=1 Tax=Pseudomonas izuensis TaxID=2684212 RepID=A0ABM7S0U6_9PSED|nr:chemotaxis protein CheW [Pseudomonas izuensis]BCX71009.1 chemotaxis protein CheW [Pseudomonas izuensis]